MWHAQCLTWGIRGPDPVRTSEYAVGCTSRHIQPKGSRSGVAAGEWAKPFQATAMQWATAPHSIWQLGVSGAKITAADSPSKILCRTADHDTAGT